MFRAFGNYCIKVFLNVFACCLIAGGCAYLCCNFIPYSEVINILSVDIPKDWAFGTEFLKKLPYIGEMIGYALDISGIGSTPEFGKGIGMLSAATFGMLMTCVYKLTEMFYSGIKKVADGLCPAGIVYRWFSNFISFVIMVYTTVVTANLLNAVLIRSMNTMGYSYWAILIVLFLLLAAMIAVKYRFNASLIKFLLDFVVNAFSAMLIYFASIMIGLMAFIHTDAATFAYTGTTALVSIAVITLLTMLFAYFVYSFAASIAERFVK